MIFKKRPFNRRVKARPKLYRMSRSVLDWIKLISLIVFVVGGSLGTYTFLTQANLFTLSSVKVTGNHPHLSDDQVVWLSDLPLGENIFGINPYKIKKNLSRFQWIREVTIKRTLPNGIHLHVEEYEPVAILVTDAGNYYVSGEGIVFKKMTGLPEQPLPEITGFLKADLEKYPMTYKRHLQKAFDFLMTYRQQADFTPLGIASVHYSVTEGLTLTTVEPKVTLYFGKENYEEKFSRFSRLLRMMEETKEIYRTVDLHIDGKIFAGK